MAKVTPGGAFGRWRPRTVTAVAAVTVTTASIAARRHGLVPGWMDPGQWQSYVIGASVPDYFRPITYPSLPPRRKEIK
jgi:hypothetical protein